MSVRKRGSHEYHYDFQVNGVREWGVCQNCTTKQEALAYERKLKEMAKELVAQKTPTALVENFKRELFGGNDISLNNAFDIYETKPTKRSCSAKQLKAKRTYWMDFCAFMHDRYPDVTMLDEVSRNHAEEYINHLKLHGRFISEITNGDRATYSTQHSLSNSTINVYHKTMRSVFSRLKEDAGLLLNPFSFDMMENQSANREAFTLNELATINDNLTPFIRPIFLLGLFTGMSEGDICLLKWSEINNNWISRRRKKTKVKLDIPILLPLQKFIAEQRLISSGSEYVLPEHAEMYLTNPSGISYRFKQFLKSLGIETLAMSDGRSRATSVKDVHSLRHTFAYIAGCCGIPISIVQSILGHMSPEMTAHYQAHASREAKTKFLKQMGQVLGTSIPALDSSAPSEYDQIVNKLKKLNNSQLKQVGDFIDKLSSPALLN